MRTSDQSEPVVMVYHTQIHVNTRYPHESTKPPSSGLTERLADILSKRVPGTSRADSPSAPVIRVRPQEVTHGSFMRNFLDPVDSSDMVERVDRGGETSVQTEDLRVSSKRGEVERSQFRSSRSVCLP